MAYEEKEIAIFRGVISLLEKGYEIHALKAADIAAAAGISKGSLYNYFDSKEEMITRAVLFCIAQDFQKAIEQVAQTEGFENKVNMIFDFIANAGSRQVMHQLLISGPRPQREALSKLVSAGQTMYAQCKKKLRAATIEVYRLGCKEGILGSYQEDYVWQVFVSVAMGYSLLFHPILLPEMTEETARQNAYKMLVHALH